LLFLFLYIEIGPIKLLFQKKATGSGGPKESCCSTVSDDEFKRRLILIWTQKLFEKKFGIYFMERSHAWWYEKETTFTTI
jgi:hypothetical protein